MTVLPSALLMLVVGCLLAAGAPSHRPSYKTLALALQHLSLRDALALLLLLVVVSVALHPLQGPLIQLLEGYWVRLPMGPALFAIASGRYVRAWEKSHEVTDAYARGEEGIAFADASAAEMTSLWLPEDDEHILPTTLGNTLRAGEVRAGGRYGFETHVLIPRLLPLLDDQQREALTDCRNQLDAAARLSAISLMCVPISLVLLLPTATWLYVPLAMFVLGWAAYQSAVAAARTYCSALAAAVDLHHLGLWRALSLRPPDNLREEQVRALVLTAFLGRGVIAPEQARAMRFLPPAPAAG